MARDKGLNNLKLNVSRELSNLILSPYRRTKWARSMEVDTRRQKNIEFRAMSVPR